MSTKLAPVIPTKAISGTATSAPAVGFVTPVVGQTPLFIEHSAAYSAGEQVQCAVRMKDGTIAYIPENQLSSMTGVVKI